MIEETQFEENKVMAPHRVEAFSNVHRNIKHLHEDLSHAFDFTAAKQQFDNHLTSLKQKEDKLRSTIRKLELSKMTLAEEVNLRESEELRLANLIDQLREQKNGIDAKIGGYEGDIKSLRTDKEKLDTLLERMKNVLNEMHEKVQEFHSIVKAE